MGELAFRKEFFLLSYKKYFEYQEIYATLILHEKTQSYIFLLFYKKGH